MGQSTSRSRQQSSSSSSPPRHGDTATAGSSSSRSNDNVTPPPSTSESSQAAKKDKKSRRRSMLDLVSRTSSSASSGRQESEEASRPHSMSLRERWRSSRRFFKTHSQLENLREPSKEAIISESAHDHPFSEVLPIPSIDAQTLAGPSYSSRPSTPFPLSRPTTPYIDPPADIPAEELSLEERQLSENIGNWLGGSPPSTTSNINETDVGSSQVTHPDSASIEREINELLSSPMASSGDTSPVGNAVSSVDPSERLAGTVHTPQGPSRHFPPPGTLVVVQGVVNTTDAPTSSSQNVSRTANTSAPPPPPPDSLLPPVRQRRSSSAPRSSRPGVANESSRRTGLSSLMPRPSSMINRRPSTSSRLSTPPAPYRDSEPIPVHAQDSLSSDSSESTQSRDSEIATQTESDGSNALSPGSIDVLGTLLSVAAAATAASLFSPGLSHPELSNGSTQPVPGRPMSPTPTAGLGGFGGLNQLSELNLEPSGNETRPSAPQPDPNQIDRDARDRLRGVWENFRDRVGFGPRANGGNPNATGTTTEGGEFENASESGSQQTPRLRPGELMLAEMARALNAGLGLTSASDRQPSSDHSAPVERGRASENPSPTETGDAVEHPRSISPDPGFDAFLTSLQADLRTVLSGDHPSTDDDTPGERADSPPPSEPQGGPQHEIDVPADVVSFADDLVDTEATNSSPPHTEQLRHHTRTPTPIPPASTLPQITSPDNEDDNPAPGDRRRPAINLWRVYRFPPIPAPPGHALRMSILPPPEDPQEPPTVLGSSTPAISPETFPLDVPATPSRSNNPDQASASDSSVVVPVIVVGLQSVDTVSDRVDFEDGTTMPHEHSNRHEESGFDPAEDFGVPPYDAASDNRPTTPRGRSWQSRAANALRGLRPGRRNSSRGQRASDNTGSRTFLIYVIGGYYPPNHHVVTGSDSLDSYEALWELADLLGQVKPPVATREDIDNSGLEIVKAAEMKQREQEGRIASNCMERCLICLDDYDPETDIRVLSCRHAFHKDCVDKWLQVGRNNCPACRSKGVATLNDSAQAPPSTAVPLS